MNFQSSGPGADKRSEPALDKPLPIFFDPTSRRKSILKGIGIGLAVLSLVWIFSFGLSLYALVKLSQIDLVGGAQSHPAEPSATAASEAAPPTMPAGSAGRKIYAYLPYWPDWNYVGLAKALPQIDALMPQWYAIDFSSGVLKPLGFDEPHQQAVAEILRGRPTLEVLPVVDLADGTTETQIVAALSSAETIRRLALALARTAEERNYHGFCVNLTGIPETAYAGTAKLFALLQDAFHGAGRETCLVSTLDSWIWDYEPLKHVVDRMVVLGFRDRPSVPQPGPLAAEDWFLTRLAALLERLDPSKVVLALGGLGYEWTAGEPDAREVSYAEAMRLASLHQAQVHLDSASLNTTFSYSEGGRRHEVWQLDAVSAYNQLIGSNDTKLAGIALWPLTDADPSVWSLLQTQVPLADPEAPLRNISLDDYVGYDGAGAFHRLLRAPQHGIRAVATDPDSQVIVAADYARLPEPYTIQRYGPGTPGTVTLTFDDGPDPAYTRSILAILESRHVPATFFVVGKNALRNPELVAQMVRDGHEIGVHTFYHPALERVSALRVRFEVNATERLIASITGRKTFLFRSPYGTGRGPLTGAEELPMRQIQDYGYDVVGADVAPRDWTDAGAESIAASVLAAVNPATGNVIQLHDGGGDRSKTIEALPKIIERLRQAGYTFVPLSAFLGKAPAELMPVDGSFIRAFDAASFGALRLGIAPVLWIFWAVTAIGIARAILVVALALLRKRHDAPLVAFTPPVTVVIPAFCEESVIVKSVSAVLASRYPALNVIVVDDGSTDSTAASVSATWSSDPRVMLISQPNGGKSTALNHAYELVDTEIVVGIDADTIVSSDAIHMLVRHFEDPQVGAVAGNVKVGNRHSLIARLQSLEYVTAQNIDRRAAEVFNGILVVPGAIGAWRRTAVEKAGYYSSQTLAEDADLTVSIARAGYRVLFEEAAIATTEAPETIRQFLRQRLRWMMGMLQTAWKHRGAFVERHWIGLVSIPELLIFSIMVATLAPIADLVFFAAVADYLIDLLVLPQTASLSVGIVAAYSVYLLSDAAVGVLALRFEPKEDKRLLLLLPFQRFLYRQLLYFSAMRALYAALSGRLMRWQKVTRAIGVATPEQAAARAARRQIQLTPR